MKSARTQPTGSVLAGALTSTGWFADRVRDLADQVGGVDALEVLDTTTFSAGTFNPTSVAEPDRSTVTEILDLVDQRAALLMNDERRCIIRRLVLLVAAHDPLALHRESTDLTAAGFVWLMMRGNGEPSRGLTSMVSALFRVPNCAARGRSLFTATGLAKLGAERCDSRPKRSDVWLANADLLYARNRRNLASDRDAVIHAIERQAALDAAANPIALEGSSITIRARPKTPRWAMRSTTAQGRAVVMVTFGDTEDSVEVIAMSVPEAHELVHMLQTALAKPIVEQPA